MATRVQRTDEATGRRAGLAWWLAAVCGTAVGVVLNLTAGRMPGSEPFGVEDVADALGGVALGALGAVLVTRGVAAGLGRALLAVGVLFGGVWLTGGLADALARGRPDPSALARALDVLNGVLFIPGFVLVAVAPLLLFPEGRPPSRRWRPVAWLAAAGVGLSMLGTLLAPGPVDEDVPGWGANPFAVRGLGGVCDAMQAAGLGAILGAVLAALAAVVVRVVTLRGMRQRQMWWFLGLVGPAIALVLGDTEGVVPGPASAVVVFTLLVVGLGYPLLGPPSVARTRDVA